MTFPMFTNSNLAVSSKSFHCLKPEFPALKQCISMYLSKDEENTESLKDVGNDLVMEVLLQVALLCIVSNNSYTNITIIFIISKL